MKKSKTDALFFYNSNNNKNNHTTQLQLNKKLKL